MAFVLTLLAAGLAAGCSIWAVGCGSALIIIAYRKYR
jgi:hypothetical protein